MILRPPGEPERKEEMLRWLQRWDDEEGVLKEWISGREHVKIVPVRNQH